MVFSASIRHHEKHLCVSLRIFAFDGGGVIGANKQIPIVIGMIVE